jgi:histidinol phosphatase-like PHP family hydrolase
MSNHWNYPGARWWKFDFHTHTPASKNTGAWQKEDAPTPETWLRQYMAAKIDCVAITDHNSGAWIDELKNAYAKMTQTSAEGFRELYLFPGVEISVNGGLHLLAIFDTKKLTSDIDSLLGKVGYTNTKGDSDGVTSCSAVQVVQAVLEAGAIPIPAHADQEKEILGIDIQTLKQVFGNVGVFAMEILETNKPKPAAYTETKLKWAEVIGSDCHSFQGKAIPGSRYTWIKMAKPSLEGLRLALLDGQDISVKRSDDAEKFSPFTLPEHFIESVEIKDAKYMGRGNEPCTLELNPYFNAIVGGRGTGKSTVIHALRLAYQRRNELTEGSEAAETFKRFNQVSNSKNKTAQGGLREDTQITLTGLPPNPRTQIGSRLNAAMVPLSL